MRTICGIDGLDYVWQEGRVYELVSPADVPASGGPVWTHGRPRPDLRDPHMIEVDLFDNADGVLRCEHGNDQTHPVALSQWEHRLCSPPQRCRMTVYDHTLPDLIKLDRYDPAKDPTTYVGSMVLFADALARTLEDQFRS